MNQSREFASRWRKMAVLAIAALAVALSFVSPAAAQVADPHVRSLTYGGSGCPQGTIGTSFSNDRTTFFLVFDQFVASQGPGIPVTESRKNCQLNINLDTTEPTSQVLRLAYRGYVNVPAGVSTETKSTYYLQGEEETSTASTTSTGPRSTDYILQQDVCVVLDEAGVSAANFNAQVRLTGSSVSNSQVTIDSIDGTLLNEPCDVPTTIVVTNPVEGGLYGRGSVVVPVVACTGYSGPLECEGVPAQLDTATSGTHSFTVTATDDLGNVATREVTYRVGSKDDCKNNGWRSFLAPLYTNQGQCVSDSVKKLK